MPTAFIGRILGTGEAKDRTRTHLDNSYWDTVVSAVTAEKGAGHNLGKNDTAQGHNIS